MKTLPCILAGILALCTATFAQTILPVGNSLVSSQAEWYSRDFPDIPSSAWYDGLGFKSHTCQMVLDILPGLLPWVQGDHPDVTVIINYTGEDDAAQNVSIPAFLGCLQQTIALERQYWPQATIITPNTIPFAPYRIGWNVNYLAPMLVDGYNYAEASANISTVNLWQAAVVPPYDNGNPGYWTYPQSDPNGAGWAAFDAVLQPVVYAAYGVQQ